MIDCKHATIEGRQITCSLGLFGGQPHIGVCMKCRMPGTARSAPRKTPSTVRVTIEAAPDKPCPSRVCRKGGRECDQYWGCRDTCRVVSERITSMTACPQPEA